VAALPGCARKNRRASLDRTPLRADTCARDVWRIVVVDDILVCRAWMMTLGLVEAVGFSDTTSKV
jgi:hypothetical protein